jgi:F-type H+-transporting ATPase subunit epsilon
VTIFRAGTRLPIVVIGGFAEVGPSGLTILADRAMPRENFDHAMLAEQIRNTEEDVADATDERIRDKLARELDQLKALKQALADTAGQGG